MATIAILGTATFDTSAGNKTVTATPAVGDLIIIVAANTGYTATTAPSDNQAGGAVGYFLAQSNAKNTSADTLQFFIRNDLIRNAASTIFTIPGVGSSGGGGCVIRVQGVWTAGSNAKVKSGGQSNQAAATPAASYTGGGAGLTGNPKLGAVFNATSPAGMTKPASFDTEEMDAGYSNPTTGLEVVSDDSGNTDSTVTWGSASASAFCSAILEINADQPEPPDGRLVDKVVIQNAAMIRATNW